MYVAVVGALVCVSVCRMIALPNPGGSFTCTMFMPFKHFDLLDAGSDEDKKAFFDVRSCPKAL